MKKSLYLRGMTINSDNHTAIFTLNLRGHLIGFDRPAVMGIVNVTDNSFYDASRCIDLSSVINTVMKMIEAGVDIIDLGGCSTRPGSRPVDCEIEMARIIPALKAIREVAPDIPVSIDTFRASVAAAALDCGADIINDVTGLDGDPAMRQLVIERRVPYILTDPGDRDMSSAGDDIDGAVARVINSLACKVADLTANGVADIIVDPGFGFGKSLDVNYAMLRHLDLFKALGRPLLVGLSRKSMIWRVLDTTPDGALDGTTALNVIALTRGAAILRVHDVKTARDIITLTSLATSVR